MEPVVPLVLSVPEVVPFVAANVEPVALLAVVPVLPPVAAAS